MDDKNQRSKIFELNEWPIEKRKRVKDVVYVFLVGFAFIVGTIVLLDVIYPSHEFFPRLEEKTYAAVLVLIGIVSSGFYLLYRTMKKK